MLQTRKALLIHRIVHVMTLRNEAHPRCLDHHSGHERHDDLGHGDAQDAGDDDNGSDRLDLLMAMPDRSNILTSGVV